MAQKQFRGRPENPKNKLTPRERRTEKWVPAFLSALAETGNVTEVCRLIGISRPTAYKRRSTNEEFAAAWDEAWELGLNSLEDEAIRRAAQGWEERVYQKGEYVGTVRKYSDLLLMFLLKANRPEKYRERTEIVVNSDELRQRLLEGRQRLALGPVDQLALPAPIEVNADAGVPVEDRQDRERADEPDQ